MDKLLMLNEIKSHYNFSSDTEFAKFLGISPQVLSNWKSRNTFDPVLLYTKCVNLNPDWLLTGSGKMTKNSSYKNGTDDSNIAAEPINSLRKTKDAIYEHQRIPLFNLEATMGLVPIVNGHGIDDDKVLDYISIPSMAICDGAIYATGDSMYPLLKAGDIVAYKKIEINPDTIFFGEIYIVALYLDEMTTMKTIKFVQKSDLGDDYVKLVSHNSHHAPKDYKLNQIAAMGLVRASIRLHN